MVETCELSAGVWIYRYESWRPASVLDTLSEDTSTTPPVFGLNFPKWYNDALCVGMDDDLFFGSEQGDNRPTLNLRQIRQAREICDQCPVAKQCLTHALTKPELYGIWAGTSGNTREKLIKQIKDYDLDVSVVVDKYLEES